MNFYIALLIAVIVNMALGFLWFGPLFGRMWMRAMGISEKEIAKMKAEKKGMGSTGYVVIVLSSLAQAAVLAAVLAWYQPATWCAGALVGSLVWLGFTLPGQAMGYLFEKRSMTVFRISSMYYLVSMAVMGALLTSVLA